MGAASKDVEKKLAMRTFTMFTAQDIKGWKFDTRGVKFLHPDRDGRQPHDRLADYYSARVLPSDFTKLAGFMCNYLKGVPIL